MKASVQGACCEGLSCEAIICNISPAKINAEETLSSLRFAERAKKIENKAVVNRDPKGERILELMQENKALRAKVARLEAHVDRSLALTVPIPSLRMVEKWEAMENGPPAAH